MDRKMMIVIALSLHVGTSGCGAGRLRAVADAVSMPLLRLRGGATGPSEQETPSTTPDSDAMMRKAEDASPLTPEQLVQLRSLPLAELLPLGEDLAELFRASHHLLRDLLTSRSPSRSPSPRALRSH
jgi:hypothetical protein